MHRSATFTTKPERGDALKAFATLRVTGDRLDPDQVTRIFKTVPTRAYFKGERYHPGPRAPEVVAKTGMWFLSTDRHVASANLLDHIAFLMYAVLLRGVPGPQDQLGLAHFERIVQLKTLMEQQALQAVITCFWHGRHGAKRPTIPSQLSSFLKLLRIEMQVDFDTDEDAPPPRAAAKG